MEVFVVAIPATGTLFFPSPSFHILRSGQSQVRGRDRLKTKPRCQKRPDEISSGRFLGICDLPEDIIFFAYPTA